MSEPIDLDALEREFNSGWAFVEVKPRVEGLIAELRRARRVVEASKQFHGAVHGWPDCEVCAALAAYEEATRE